MMLNASLRGDPRRRSSFARLSLAQLPTTLMANQASGPDSSFQSLEQQRARLSMLLAGTQGPEHGRTESSQQPGLPPRQVTVAVGRAEPLPGAAKPTVPPQLVALHHRSLFLFPGDWKVRVLVYQLTHHRVFEGVIITLIFANCVSLAMDDPMKQEQPAYLGIMEIFFTVAFAVEMCLKVFAHGFVLHPGSYLRSGWNMLDFLIVAMSFLAFLPFFGNYSAIRTLRVLRPLRSINGIRGLRNIVNGLLGSLRKLVNVLALAAFLFFIFGILGVQLFGGRFVYRCQLKVDLAELLVSGNVTSCGLRADCGQEPGGPAVPGVEFLMRQERDTYCSTGSDGGGLWGRACDEGYVCVDSGENPNSGFTSFDHVGYAFLAIFQCLTMEGWTDIMYVVQDVWSSFGVFYFILLVILGSFLILNLALAVINEEFTAINEATKQERLQEIREIELALLAWETQMLAAAEAGQEEWDETGEEMVGLNTPRGRGSSMSFPGRMCESDPSECASAGPPTQRAGGPRGVLRRSDAGQTDRLRKRASFSRDVFTFQNALIDESKSASGVATAGRGHICGLFMKMRWMCYAVVTTKYFQPTVVFFIVVNTLLLAAEHHNQPDILTNSLDVANVVLGVVFLFELILKLAASGPKAYFEDRFNVLDASVVAMSVIEFTAVRRGCVMACPEGSGANVSVFRALRLLRVFKLLKNWGELRKLIEVILSAVSDTGYLNLIILLYLFIAALMGMQFFGGKFDFPDRDDPVPRANFNSFYSSLLTVFQILTRDDWVNVMWDAMTVSGEGSAIFFLVLVICGDFLILNLFLAILIQSFEENVDPGTDDDEEIAPPVVDSKTPSRAGASPLTERSPSAFPLHAPSFIHQPLAR
eukprot:Hpha_TRINITY_DN13881_c0_g2::TRINITY_DN13881_c0_g2_i1::g.70008::m.70008